MNNLQYVQDFNGLSSTGVSNTWSNNATLPGWYIFSTTTFSTYSADNGSSSIKPALYSYGSANSSDRALGIYSEGSSNMGVFFENNTSKAIESITITFRHEQWRRCQHSTSSLFRDGHQRAEFSYVVGSNLIVNSALMTSTDFVEVPEANMVTIDTVLSGPAISLDGNGQLDGRDNFSTVSVTFPVALPKNQQIFLKFYDRGDPFATDIPFALDDFTVSFSHNSVQYITATTGYDIFAYLDQGVVEKIPGEDAGYSYTTPTATDITNWNAILDAFYDKTWNSTLLNNSYEYQLAEYNSLKDGKKYFILRKESSSTYYWGTYVINDGPANTVLAMQAPHGYKDTFTGSQAAAIFHQTDAAYYMVNGISRCTGTAVSGCDGSNTICYESGSGSHKKSDVAHNTDAIFHIATVVLGAKEPSLVFVQMHGFASGPADFIISNGMISATGSFTVSVPDYPVMLRHELMNLPFNWTTSIPHAGGGSLMSGTDNVQGRFLNASPSDYCSGADVTSVTNRFLHVEQLMAPRQYISYYDDLANAIGNVVNPDPYQPYLEITPVNMGPFTEDFTSLNASASTFRWGNNVNLPGWYAVRSATRGVYNTFLMDDGSSASSALASYGSSSSSDRALGTLDESATAFGVLFKNNTGLDLKSFRIKYQGEQWRTANNIFGYTEQRLKFSYRVSNSIDLSANGLTNSSLFTVVPQGDIVTLNSAQADQAIDGNQNSTIKEVVVNVDIPNGSQVFLRFYDEGYPGSNQAFAIDDFSISFFSAPLPVTWAYVEVIDRDNQPLVRWAATREDMCDHYEVQRSFDGRKFTTIAIMACQKTPALNLYQYPDVTHAKLAFYRIAQFDIDKEVTYSKVVAYYRENHLPIHVSYQNGMLEIQYSPDDPIRSVVVYDSKGKELLQHTPEDDPNGFIQLPLQVNSQLIIIKFLTSRHVETRRLLIF